MCIVLYFSRDGEWIKQARGNGNGCPKGSWSCQQSWDAQRARESKIWIWFLHQLPLKLEMPKGLMKGNYESDSCAHYCDIRRRPKGSWREIMNLTLAPIMAKTGNVQQALETDSKTIEEAPRTREVNLEWNAVKRGEARRATGTSEAL